MHQAFPYSPSLRFYNHQDPAQWDDAELSHLVVPEADYASDSEEEEGEEEEEEEEQEQEQHQSSPPIDDTPRKRSRK